MDTFNILAGLASILGLGFTIYAVIEVVKLRHLFYLVVRGSQMLHKMRAFTATLLEELNAIKSSGGGVLERETVARLKEHESRLGEIAKNLPSMDRVGITKARSKLAEVLQSDVLSVEDGWTAYDQLLIAVALFEDLIAKYELKA